MDRETIGRYITSNPEVLRGKPCIRGTRIPVYLIAGFADLGMTPAEIIDDYPHLIIAEVDAAIAFGKLANERGINLERLLERDQLLATFPELGSLG